MWFEATARLANLPGGRDGGDGEKPSTFVILVGGAVGGCVLLSLVAFAIYRYNHRKERDYSDTEEDGGGWFSWLRRDRGGVSINGRVQILGLRRVSKERPVRAEEFEDRPFYSNLMNLIMPQQTKDQDDWNMHRQMGHKPTGGRRDPRNKAHPNDRNRKGKGDLTLTGERSHRSAPESVKALFSCAGLTDNTICNSAPAKGRRNYDDDGDSYNFTVETPFSEYTGRSSGQSSRQSSRYDDTTTTASSQSSRQFRRYDYDDSTASGNTYADDSYASSQSRPSARDRARPIKSKSTSRSRSHYDRDRYDQGSVDSNTYADD